MAKSDPVQELSDSIYEGEKPAEQRQAEEKVLSDHDRYVENIKAIMGVVQGRDFIHHLLGVCGCFRSIFSQNSMLMSMREGERNVGLQLTELLQKNTPNEYIEMLREHL